MIGSCKDFDFRSDSMVTSNVTALRQFANHWNAWRGEWIKIVLDSISFLECPIDGWIGGSDPSKPTFQTSSCIYKSKYSMGCVSQGKMCKVILNLKSQNLGTSQGVLSFRDFWFQTFILKYEDHMGMAAFYSISNRFQNQEY